MTNPNIAIQQQFVTAVFAGDAAALRALCTDNFVLTQGSGMPYAGTFAGADGFLQFLGIFADTLEIEKLEPVRHFLSDDPDLIVFEFDIAGVHRATGRPYATSLLETWAFRDGKVSSVKPHYFNVPD